MSSVPEQRTHLRWNRKTLSSFLSVLSRFYINPNFFPESEYFSGIVQKEELKSVWASLLLHVCLPQSENVSQFSFLAQQVSLFFLNHSRHSYQEFGAFSVKSLTNLLRPFEILTHEWDPSPDRNLILTSIPSIPWWYLVVTSNTRTIFVFPRIHPFGFDDSSFRRSECILDNQHDHQILRIHQYPSSWRIVQGQLLWQILHLYTILSIASHSKDSALFFCGCTTGRPVLSHRSKSLWTFNKSADFKESVCFVISQTLSDQNSDLRCSLHKSATAP